MAARMTAEVWNRGSKNALICVCGILVVLSVLTFANQFLFDHSLTTSFVVAFVDLWIVTFAWFLFAIIQGKISGGAVLLDCGPHPTRWLFLLNAGLFCTLSFSGIHYVRTSQFEFPTFLTILLAASFPIFWLIMSFGRLQIRQNGLWQYWGLMSWDKLQSFEWKGSDGSTLMITAKTQFPFLNKGALPVPLELKDQVDQWLKKITKTEPEV